MPSNAAVNTSANEMKYRFLGNSGLLVSTFGLGLMMHDESDIDGVYALLVHAFQRGVNFWDTAEFYGKGSSERALGVALQRGIAGAVWTRDDIVLTTKIFYGPNGGPNGNGLSRKHVIEGTKASLQRLAIDYVDVIYCHRMDPQTPMEEIVRAMNYVLDQGWAFYWGTSEWRERDILEARAVAQRLGLIGPIAEQPQYNLLTRTKVEVEYTSLLQASTTHGSGRLGLTTWSPLASGLLTGKYAHGKPDGARLANPKYARLVGSNFDTNVAAVEELRPIADELSCSVAQLTLAWCASNDHVSSVLLGVKTVKQLDENLGALSVVARLTPEVKQRIDEILPLRYKASELDHFCFVRGQYL